MSGRKSRRNRAHDSRSEKTKSTSSHKLKRVVDVVSSSQEKERKRTRPRKQRKKQKSNYLPILCAFAGMILVGACIAFFMTSTSPDSLREMKLPSFDIKNFSGPDAEEALLKSNNWSAAHEGVVRNFVKQGRAVSARENEILRAWGTLADSGTTFYALNNTSDRDIREYIKRFKK